MKVVLNGPIDVYIVRNAFIKYVMNVLQIIIIRINNIDPDSEKNHKISREMLQAGIPIEVALDKFNRFSNKCDLLVGHNVSFDKRMNIPIV